MRLFPRAFSVFSVSRSSIPDGSYGGIKKTLPTLLSLFYPVGKGGMGSSLPNRDSNSNLSFLATIF